MSNEDGRSPEFRRGRCGRWNGSGRRRCRKYGEAEARVIALYEGRQGYANRSLRLLAGKVVELGDKPRNGEADAKKRLLLQKESPVPGDSARKRSSWRNKCLKEKPYDPRRPVVCMDEQPVQLVDSRAPLPRIRRVDYERAGTAFMFCEALSSRCRATARKRRTKADWAEEVAGLRPLRELRAPSCATTSTPARRERSTKRPARARELVKRACYTPKRGSWLNVAENELRIRQCLRHRRLGDIETLRTEAWSVDVNERQRGVDWKS